MFDRVIDYPVAVASYDDEGMNAAIAWCVEHMEDGETLTVWTSQKSNLENSTQLERLVTQHSDVRHVTGRGGNIFHGNGPVLMAWPDMNDIGKLLRYGAPGMRALCVISWNDDEIRPWLSAVHPTVLGDGTAWGDLSLELDPLVVEALKGLTLTINHNNTIAAGFEKDMVVSALLALREARIPMHGKSMQGWALANGWSGENPQHLAKYVNDINAGKRPKHRNVLRPDYITTLRRRAKEREAEQTEK